MEKPTITSEKLSKIFSASHTVISEKLSPEDYNQFVEEVAAQNALLETANAQLQSLNADLSNAKNEKEDAEKKLKQISSEKVLLEAEVVSLKPFKDKIEQIASSGRTLPGADANSSASIESKKPANHPDMIAINSVKSVLK